MVSRVLVPRRAHPQNHSNIWPQRWSKIPRYPHENLENYMRKTLIYYPKNLKVLIPITAEIFSELVYLYEHESNKEGMTRIKTLYRQILAKYKRSYIRHQSMNTDYKDPYTYKPKRLESLRLYHNEKVIFVLSRDLCGMLKLSKGIKHLEIDGSVACADILTMIRYIPSLESLYIRNFPSLSGEEADQFVKSVLVSKASLKTITLIGSINMNPSKLFKMFKELYELKTVNLEGRLEEKNFDISKMPYKMFKERGIHFNIRLQYTKPELKIETKNKSDLMPLDFLGISYKHRWPQDEVLWNSYFEDHIKIQEKAKRALFVNFPLIEPKENPRLYKLFRHCKNVETLDICLVRNVYKCDKKDFEGLKYFENLKHIFMELDSTRHYWHENDTELTFYERFFKELTPCAAKLRSVHLHLCGQVDLKGEFIKFFKACADSLTHVTLKFSYFNVINPNDMNGIHSCLKGLKRIESLKVVSATSNQNIFGNKDIFLSPSLKEVSITAQRVSIQNFNLDFKSLTNLEKMQLCIESLDDNSKFFPKKLIMPNSLKRIELSLTHAFQKTWYELLVQLGNIPVLEILMLRIGFVYEKDGRELKKVMVLNDVKLLFKGHRSLKFMTYSEDALDEIYVFAENDYCCQEDEIEQFYGKSSSGILRKRIQKVFKIQKERKEQTGIVDYIHQGLKKFFLDLFSMVKSHYDAMNG